MQSLIGKNSRKWKHIILCEIFIQAMFPNAPQKKCFLLDTEIYVQKVNHTFSEQVKHRFHNKTAYVKRIQYLKNHFASLNVG